MILELFYKLIWGNKILIQGLDKYLLCTYALTVAANSATERDNSNSYTRRTNAISPIFEGVFLCLSYNGSRAWATLWLADYLVYRFVTPRMAAAQFRDKISGSSHLLPGAIVMAIFNQSRLCADNRALSLFIQRYLSFDELTRLNTQLHGFFKQCLTSGGNSELAHAYGDITNCLTAEVFIGNAQEQAKNELIILLAALHSHLAEPQLITLHTLLTSFIDVCIEQRKVSLQQLLVAYAQLKPQFYAMQGGV